MVKLFLGLFIMLTVMQLTTSIFFSMIVLFPAHKTNLNRELNFKSIETQNHAYIQYEIFIYVSV